MSDILTAFWGMTINNYDETDMAMIHHGYPDHMRELVHTLEQGEEGTPHIQAYLKLKRQQRLSFVKKLFPRGHFKALTSAAYIENTKSYAQKLDATARSPAVHKFYDPIHTIEGQMKQVMRRIEADMSYEDYSPKLLHHYRLRAEKRMVEEDYTHAKVFVSATYKQMWKHFGEAMYSCLQPQFEAERVGKAVSFEDTHTHTHSEEKISREGGITNDGSAKQDSEDEEGLDSEEQDSESQQDSEGEDCEADGSCSEADCEDADDSGSGDEICL